MDVWHVAGGWSGCWGRSVSCTWSLRKETSEFGCMLEITEREVEAGDGDVWELKSEEDQEECAEKVSVGGR